jgi:hypothetical protein
MSQRQFQPICGRLRVQLCGATIMLNGTHSIVLSKK